MKLQPYLKFAWNDLKVKMSAFTHMILTINNQKNFLSYLETFARSDFGQVILDEVFFFKKIPHPHRID